MSQTDRLNGLTGTQGIKDPVKAVSNAALTLSGEQTVNGVAVVAQDRVLVKDQTNTVDNGIYDVKVGAWARSSDLDGTSDAKVGTLVTAASGNTYMISTIGTIGVSAMTFSLYGGASTSLASTTHDAASKNPIVDADELPVVDSAASWALKKVTVANLKTSLAQRSQGKESIWVPSGAFAPRLTNGPSVGIVETATNKVLIRTLDFDATTAEYAQFPVRMPKSWNLGTITATFVWSHAATTVNFGAVWQIAGVAVSDDDALDAAFGTPVGVADTGGTTNDLYQSAESGAVTIAGTPAALDTVIFQINRLPTDGSDTLAIDGRLHGVLINFTTNAANDA